jgi:hypothetical protein
LSYLKEKVEIPVSKTEIKGRGIRSADHLTLLYPEKLALASPTSGGRLVVRFVNFVFVILEYWFSQIRYPRR